MAGRPSLYTPELANSICERLASGESLCTICAEDDFPSKSTVLGWVVDDREGFADQYARSRKIQAEVLADEIFAVADDGSNDWQETKFGPMVNGEAVQRSRLRVDTRKWYLSKVLPKVYGDKLDLNHAGEVAIKRVVADL
jgi:hypothetical protein